MMLIKTNPTTGPQVWINNLNVSQNFLRLIFLLSHLSHGRDMRRGERVVRYGVWNMEQPGLGTPTHMKQHSAPSLSQLVLNTFNTMTNRRITASGHDSRVTRSRSSGKQALGTTRLDYTAENRSWYLAMQELHSCQMKPVEPVTSFY